MSAEQSKITLSSLLQNLEAAEKQTEAVEHRISEELKAMKHLAHVKDLGRVAAIREVGTLVLGDCSPPASHNPLFTLTAKRRA